MFASKAEAVPVADRPCCAFCGKPRIPQEVSVRWPAGGDFPKVGQRVQLDGYKARFVEVHALLWHEPSFSAFKNEQRGDYVDLTFWSGGWKGYGPFCKLDCAYGFAIAAHRAGYRMKKNSPPA